MRIRIRILQLKLMRMHANLDPDTDPDPKPWMYQHEVDQHPNLYYHKMIESGEIRNQKHYGSPNVLSIMIYFQAFLMHIR